MPASMTMPAPPAPARARRPRPLRLVKKAAKRVIPAALALYFVPYLFAGYVAVGLMDVLRNRRRTLATLDRYFAGNGAFTWLLSPFNLLLDVLCLPYRNRGVYRLADLPPGHQAEINALIAAAHRRDLVGALADKMAGKQRGMIFFKWYGKNIQTSVDVPEFHQPFRYIRTIGVSVFNKRQSTGKHFGPLRITLRVLYNVNDIRGKAAYIKVGGHTNYWSENKLFIFDDTLQHQSCNESDALRYCMFVDILRPTLVPRLTSGLLTAVRLGMAPFRAVFYKHWTFLK
jgi:beta-hydroxylase